MRSARAIRRCENPDQGPGASTRSTTVRSPPCKSMMCEYFTDLIWAATLRIRCCGPIPNASVTFGLSLTSETYWRLVSTVTRAPGHLVRIARRRGVVSRMSPIELNRTTRMSGDRKELNVTAGNVDGGGGVRNGGSGGQAG